MAFVTGNVRVIFGPNGRGVRSVATDGRYRCLRVRSAASLSWPQAPVAREMNGFDRHKFISQAIEGELPDRVLNNAIVAAMGFQWDPERNEFADGRASEKNRDMCRRVSSEFPPNFVSDGCANEILERQLPTDEDIVVGMSDYIEVIYGEDLTKVSREARDEAFLRREVVCKWLYHYGGF